jgi:hypothetical protein
MWSNRVHRRHRLVDNRNRDTQNKQVRRKQGDATMYGETRMKILTSIYLLTGFLTGCGYYVDPKEITLSDGKDQATVFSCGSYMHVSSSGWNASTYDVTYTDADGLTHNVYGVKGLAVSDVPRMIDAPFWKFSNDVWTSDARYSNQADGTPGELIREGDVVVNGDNRARVVNGKYVPIKIQNTACKKSS